MLLHRLLGGQRVLRLHSGEYGPVFLKGFIGTGRKVKIAGARPTYVLMQRTQNMFKHSAVAGLVDYIVELVVKPCKLVGVPFLV